jgi:hypothetical protein
MGGPSGIVSTFLSVGAADGKFTIENLGTDFDAGPDSFVDCAAVIENLDLVVTSDTAIAHLAGALGRPVFVALKSVPDWRWLLHREDSPWYPVCDFFARPKKEIGIRFSSKLPRLSRRA